MDTDADIATTLAILRLESDSSELIGVLYEFEDFYERKLWHQLTLKLNEFYHTTPGVTQELKCKVFDSFVSNFASRLNAIKVVDYLLESVNGKPQDTLDKLTILRQQFVDQLRRDSNTKTCFDEHALADAIAEDELVIYADLQLARYHLILSHFTEAQDILDSLRCHFDPNSSHSFENPELNSAYYLANSSLNRVTDNYTDFYHNGLLYLSAIENSVPDSGRAQFCFELCMAALLGDKIYNIGELILHDILDSIKDKDGEYFWLYSLIHYLNAGNLEQFTKWMAIAKQKSPLLAARESFLNQKITITALLELVSSKATGSKQLTFDEISSFTGVPLSQVELLLIKSFSLNLTLGCINQVNKVVDITWLQPRVLNLDQVKTLHDHLTIWDKQVEDLAHTVHKNGGSVWAGI